MVSTDQNKKFIKQLCSYPIQLHADVFIIGEFDRDSVFSVTFKHLSSNMWKSLAQGKGCKLECNVLIPIYVCSIFEAQRPGRSFSVQQRLGAFLFKVEIFVK